MGHYLNIICRQQANGGIDFTFIPIIIDFTPNVNYVTLFEAKLSTLSSGENIVFVKSFPNISFVLFLLRIFSF